MFVDRVRDRLDGLDRREVAGLLVIALLVVAGAGLWYVRSLPARVEVVSEATAPRGPSPAASPSPLVVHVAGWVREPGVYELHEGDRVVDALQRARGPRAGADLTGINLAALVADGQQILVLKRGAGGGAAPGSATAAGGAAGSDTVNLNTATVEQLETLPGIGEVLAQRIVDHREQHGPFRSIEDLLNVSGIGDKRFEDLRPHITV